MLLHALCTVTLINIISFDCSPVISSCAGVLQVVVYFPLSLYSVFFIPGSACVAFRRFSIFSLSISSWPRRSRIKRACFGCKKVNIWLNSITYCSIHFSVRLRSGWSPLIFDHLYPYCGSDVSSKMQNFRTSLHMSQNAYIIECIEQTNSSMNQISCKVIIQQSQSAA